MIVKPVTESLAEAALAASEKGLPPVEKWDPPFCGDIDMRIARDGTWFYLGTPIGRAPLVRLFSTILKREGDRYFLVTPVEKVGIEVEDAPFVAVDFERTERNGMPVLIFITNVGDRVAAGSGHEIRVTVAPGTGEPAPYLHVRAGLDALIDRKSFYRLAEIGERDRHEGRDWFGFRSGGLFFPAIPADEMP